MLKSTEDLTDSILGFLFRQITKLMEMGDEERILRIADIMPGDRTKTHIEMKLAEKRFYEEMDKKIPR